MATRRDQLQSYQFLVQRVIAAFVMRETDPAQSPLRRGVGAVFAGLMIAVVLGAGFGVVGILTRVGPTGWKSDGSVVIEKETGASYVYLAGKLHPTLNYTSALLASGKPRAEAARVPGKALAAVPRGLTIGIPGAPDSLPDQKKRIGLPWTVCGTRGTDRSGNPTAVVTLVLAGAPVGGTALDDRGVLVTDDKATTTYLVWHGLRYPVQQPRSIVPALFGNLATPTPVGNAWLDTLPRGVDIAPLTVPSRGKASAKVPGRTIGQVLIAGPSRYLVLDDGLAPLTPLQEAVLGSQFAAPPIQVTVRETSAAPASGRLEPPSAEVAAPQSPPVLVTPTAADPVCAVTDGPQPRIWVGGTIEGLDTAVPTGSVSAEGVRLADRVRVLPGRVAVVRVMGAPGTPSGAYYVVTDLGIRYAVPSAAVLAVLGYQPGHAVDIPASLVMRIPAGPALEPEAATKVAAPTSER